VARVHLYDSSIATAYITDYVIANVLVLLYCSRSTLPLIMIIIIIIIIIITKTMFLMLLS